MLQPGLFLHVRRLPAVTARWWCGTSRSRYVSVAALYTVKQQSVFTCTPSVCVIWSADLLVCPGRLRWPAGFCCRRPTTSPMPSLCVDWHGSPPQPRFVTQAEETYWLITMIRTTGDNLEVIGVLLCFCTQFLAVPVETKVHLYERDSWNHVSSLSDDLLTQVSSRWTLRNLHG